MEKSNAFAITRFEAEEQAAFRMPRFKGDHSGIYDAKPNIRNRVSKLAAKAAWMGRKRIGRLGIPIVVETRPHDD
jgi:hypothetical protein